MTFVCLFFVELALLFLCLEVFDSPGFHCFLQTCLHCLPRWFPFTLFINHLIAKSYQFPLKAQSHSNFLHRLHQFYSDYILFLDCLSFLCSFNPSIDQLGHVAGDTQSCLVGCNWYNLHVYCLDEIGAIEFSVCCHFHPLQYLFLHSFNHSFCSDATSLFNPQEFIDFVSSGSMVFILSSNT